MLSFLLFIALGICILHLLFNYNYKARLIRKIPGPKDYFLIGNALFIFVSPVELFYSLRNLAMKWKDINRISSSTYAAINIYNPDDIEMIISNTKHNQKSEIYKFMRPWLREGLLLSHGLKWHQRRKILTPAFHFNILRQFNTVFKENSQSLVSILENTAGITVNITSVLTESTLNIICETAMGTRLNDDATKTAKTYKEAIYELGHLIVQRVSRLYLYPDIIFKFSILKKQQKKYLNILQTFTKRVIHNRKKYIEEHGFRLDNEQNLNMDVLTKKMKNIAMLDLLILAEKENLIDNFGIQEEVDTFMFEGHDTTAAGLIYCLMVLANHKEIQDKIYAEMVDIFGDSTRAANTDDLVQMRYLEYCIKESLRLYPPVPFIGRVLSDTVKIGGYTIPEGTLCHIHIYDLHRREDIYPNPLKFDPDRFLPENCKKRHPYSYIPFSAGPRNCIGQKFALMEMKSLVSAVIRRFELIPETKPADLLFITHLVLKNTAPVYVTFKKRNQI